MSSVRMNIYRQKDNNLLYSKKVSTRISRRKYQKLMKCLIRVTCNKKKTEKFKHCMVTLQRAFDQVADSWRTKSLEFLRSPPYLSILGSRCVNQVFFLSQ